VAQGRGEDEHETPHVLHKAKEKSPCGKRRKEKGRRHVGSLCVAPCVCHLGISLNFSKILQSYIKMTEIQGSKFIYII